MLVGNSPWFRMQGRPELVIFTDSQNLAQKVSTDKKMTSDKRLRIVLAMLQEAVRQGPHWQWLVLADG